MTPQEIVFSPQAEKDMKSMSKAEQKVVFDALKKWKSGGPVSTLEKIKSQPAFYRMKVRHIRMIYYPLGGQRALILLVRDRKKIYRNLDNLDVKLATAMRSLKIVSR